MGKRSSTSVLVLTFWALTVVVAAQGPRGTERLSLPNLSGANLTSNASCLNVDCQQGTCVPNDNILVSFFFPYKCECSQGWATVQNVAPLLAVPSLPCNVPNCSLNLNCSGDSPAAAPSPSSSITSANVSICLIPGICGHGTCEPITGTTIVNAFKCVCDPGYTNVLNTTAGYCVSQCELKGGCQNLNMTLPGLTSTSPLGAPTTAAPAPPSAGCRGISFNSGICIATTMAVVWSFLSSYY